MAGKLGESEMDQLESWIGSGPKIFTLLYSITRDGCSAQTFHNKCDNKGPTVTVLYNPQNSVYGGYTSLSWQSNGQYGNDGKAFLYQLRFSGNPKAMKFPVKQANNGNYSHTQYGPTFGSGHDLLTFQGNINNSGGYFALSGGMNIGTSFNNQGVTAANINNGSMNVTDLEVYAVTDGERKKIIGKPWRKTPEWNAKLLESLTEDIITFKPLPDLNIAEFRIVMIGPVGAGKSSFYNTINSVFRERMSQRARSGNALHSITTAYIPYTIRTRSGASLNFRLCDTRGLEETQGLDILECNSLLDGHVPEYYEFNPAAQISADNPAFVEKPSLNDKVHCVLFLLDATTINKIPAKVLEKMNSFQKIMNQKGIPQVCILTKIDLVCPAVAETTANVFLSKNVEKAVDETSKILGLPRNSILPVKNYENEMELDENTSILALLALRQILYFAEDFMENLQDKLKVAKKVHKEKVFDKE